MPILSNNARSIESLALTSTIESVDQLIIQQATGDKYYTRRCLVSSLKTSLFTSVTITSGTINNTIIGATTAATIKGTTITATTGFIGNVTSAGTSSFTHATITNGTINNTTIGATTAAAITGTTITANTKFIGPFESANVTITGGTINGTSIGADVLGTIRGTTIAAITGFTGNVIGNVTSAGTSSFTHATITGGTINGTTIGATTAAAITGTTITANTKFIGPFESTAATITGGTINGTIIGGTAPVAITGTTITANTKFIGPFESTAATITGGTINGTIIGGTAPVAVTGTTITGTTITATTRFTGTVTGSVNGNVSSTGTSTFSNATITGGTINNTIIGGTTPVAVTGTTITGTSITATTGFIGDILSDTNVKVLDNGAGGVSTANFYGTSSNAKTSSYATKNGIPSGGTSGYVLTKNSGTSYDVVWGTGGGGGTVTSPAVSGSIKKFISSSIYADLGTVNVIPKRVTPYTWGNSTIIDNTDGVTMTSDVTVNQNLRVIQNFSASRISGRMFEYRSNTTTVIASASVSGGVTTYPIVNLTSSTNGYGLELLNMSASIRGLCIFLRSGQYTNILIQTASVIVATSDTALKTILGWSGSTNNGVSNKNILWDISGSVPRTKIHNALVKIQNISGIFLGSWRSYRK